MINCTCPLLAASYSAQSVILAVWLASTLHILESVASCAILLSYKKHYWGYNELGAVLFGVVGFRGDDTPEIVRPVHGILFGFHENGEERFRHGGDVGVHWIFRKGNEFFARLL